jgi:pilus assembly protein CpaB
MADRRFTLVLYVAILTAAAATFGVYRVLQTNAEKNKVPVRPVVVAALDLPEGSVLPKEALQIAEWPVAAAPEGAFAAVDSLVGRVTRVPVFKGEAIVPGRLTPVGTGGGLEVKIAPGKRAMAIRINDVASVSNMIQANSRVDVLLMLNADVGNGQTQPVAKTIMENMKVLSVGQQMDRGADGRPIAAPTATLEVTPAEMEMLALATTMGGIQLGLRGYGDTDSSRTGPALSMDLLKKIGSGRQVASAPPSTPRQEPPRRTSPAPAPIVRPAAPVAVTPPPPPKPDSVTVQVYRGAQVQQQKFQVPDSVKKP